MLRVGDTKGILPILCRQPCTAREISLDNFCPDLPVLTDRSQQEFILSGVRLALTSNSQGHEHTESGDQVVRSIAGLRVSVQRLAHSI